jgi:hypothetical protein
MIDIGTVRIELDLREEGPKQPAAAPPRASEKHPPPAYRRFDRGAV